MDLNVTYLRALRLPVAILVFCLGFISQADAQVSVFYSDFVGDELPREDVTACLDSAAVNAARLVFTVSDPTGDVEVEIQLPPGITYIPGSVALIDDLGSPFAVTEFDISDPNAPIFLVSATDGTIEFGNQVIFEWSRSSVTCDALSFQMTGGTFKDALTIEHSAGTVLENDPSVNAYDLLVGSLSITEPESIEVNFGDTITKDINIVNGGLGCVDTFTFWMVEESGIVTTELIHAGVVIMPTVVGDTLFYEFNTQNFLNAGLGGCLDNGEVIELQRTVAVIECNTDTEMQAYWGCAGSICQASLVVTCDLPLEGGVPEILYTRGSIIQATNFCDSIIVQHNFTNSGGALAYNLQYLAGFNARGLSLSQTSGTPTRDFPPVAVCINGVDVPFIVDEIGPTEDTGLVVILDSLMMDPDGPGGLEDLDGDGAFDDLAPGESYSITIKHVYNVDVTCPSRQSTGRYKVATAYSDECGDFLDLVIQNATGNLFNFTLDGEGTVLGPATIYNGETFELMVCGSQRFGGNMLNCPTNSLTLKGEIPTGFSLLGSSMFGTTEISPAIQVGDSIFYEAVFDDNDAICFNLELVLDCDILEGSRMFDFEMEYLCDEACGEVEIFSCPPYTPVVVCGDPCPYGGLTITSVEAIRQTTGFSSPTTCDTFADASMISPVQLRRGMPHDTFCIVAKSEQKGGLSGGPDQEWANAYLDIEYEANNNAEVLQYTGGTFEIWDESAMTYTSFDLPPPFFDQRVGRVHTFSFEFNDSLPANGLEPMDSVNVNLKVIVLKNTALSRENAARLEGTNIRFYNLVDTIQDNDPDLDMVRCLDNGLEMYLHRPEYSTTGINRPIARGCNDYQFRSNASYDGGPGDLYPGEIRPYYLVDSIVLEYTTCDVLNVDATFLDSEGNAADGYPSSRLRTFVGPPTSSVFTDSVIRHVWVNPGTWPKGDQNGLNALESGYTFYPTLTPTCRSKNGTINISFFNQRFGYAHDTTCYEPSTRSSTRTILQRPPRYSIEDLSGEVLASTDTVVWDLDIRNISNEDGFFLWMAFEDRLSSLTLLDIRCSDADTLIPLNPYINGDWIRLTDELLRTREKEIQVRGLLSQCDGDSIRVTLGWECTGYPMDPPSAPCVEDTIYIKAKPQLSEVQLAIDRDPELPIDLCSSDTFQVLFSSAQAAFLNDPVFRVILPQGAILGQPITMEYPANSGNTEFVMPVVTGNVVDIFMEGHSGMSGNGLPGTIDELDPDIRSALFDVVIETDCDFTSGDNLRFIGTGLRPCGEPAINDEIQVRSADIRVDGADPPYLVEFNIGADGDSILAGCDPNTVAVELTLSPFLETATKPGDTLTVTLDPGLSIDPNSIVCTATDDNTCLEFASSETDPLTGFTTVKFAYPETPIDLSQDIVVTSFEFDIIPDVSLTCDILTMVDFRSVSTVENVPCQDEPGGFCLSLRTTTGFVSQGFILRRIVPTFSGISVGYCSEANEFLFSGQLNVDSLDLEDNEELVIDVFCADLFGEPVGEEISRIFIPGPIMAGDSTLFEGEFSGICDVENGVVFSVRQTASNGDENCVCEDVLLNLEVEECPEVEVGTIGNNFVCSPDQTTEVFANILSDDPTVRGLWSTTGTGFFFDLASTETEYFWSADDIANGEVFLIYTLRPTVDSLCAKNDSVRVFFQIDDTPPNIICPQHKHADSDPGLCGHFVDLPDLEVIEDCTDPRNLLVEFAINDDTLSIGIPDTAFFPVGTNTVTIVVSDLSGNTDTCRYDIIIEDVEAPLVECPDLAALPELPWINEIGYENRLGDVGEFIEIAGPAGFDLSNCIVFLYDGATGAFYRTDTLTGQVIPDEGAGFGAVALSYPNNSIQNGPDGIALVCDGAVLQFLSYEGSFSANDGPAAGMMSTDIGVSEPITDPIGNSLQFTGAGFVGAWNPPAIESPGVLNDGQDISEIMGLVEFEVLPGTCVAQVSGLGITIMDNCDSNLIVTNTSPYGTDDASGEYEAGVHTVTYTVMDSAGNVASCSISFLVVDTELPTLECGGIRQAQDSDPGVCTFTATDGELDPIFDDNCPGAMIFHSYDVAPDSTSLDGASFPVGETEVIWVVMDAAGNKDSCTIVINVEDVEDPVFVNCPTSDTVFVGNSVDLCMGSAIFSTPIANDNCGLATVTQISGPTSGEQLDLGIYDISFVASDEEGNTDTCSFVLVLEDSEQPTIICPGNMILAQTTPGECSWTAPAGKLSLLGNLENCPVEVSYHLLSPAGDTLSSGMDDASGETFGLDSTVVCYVATETEDPDLNGIQSDTCCFWVVVEDVEAPEITCPTSPITLPTSDMGDCAATNVGTALDAMASDNCGVAMLSHDYAAQADSSTLDGAVFEVGETSVIWTAVDTAGNVSTCEIVVLVQDSELPTIDCSAIDGDRTTDPGECSFTMPGSGFDPVYADNCQDSIITHDYVTAPNENTLAGASFPVGTSTVIWTVTDAAGNSATCEITITVEDDENPTFINCPSDTISVATSPDQCSASVNWVVPVATDNCIVDTVEQVSGPSPGSDLPVGFHEVEYQVSDENGNSASCVFIVEVMDTQFPTITCPGNMVTASTSPGECSWTSEDGKLSLLNNFENCPVEVTYSIISLDGDTLATGMDDASGEVFELGMTQVCYVATEMEDLDLNGITTDTCCFMVLVEDQEDPVITCPADVTLVDSEDNLADCGASIEDASTDATATDNCSIVSLSHNYDAAPDSTTLAGALFPLGTTEVIWTAVDTAGNTVMCMYTVTVNDDVTPSIICPVDTVLSSDNQDCDAQFTWLHPVPRDNCPLGSLIDYTVSFTNPDGSVDGPNDIRSLLINSDLETTRNFDVGTTVVEYFVNDPGGNTVNCTFEVTVEDFALPILIGCPDSAIVVDNDAGWCGAIVNLPTIFALDGCTRTDSLNVEFNVNGAGWSSLDPSGQFFPADTTIIQARAIDDAGNIDSCEFSVIVLDKEVPEVVCTNLFFEQPNDICSVDISALDLAALSTDNCGVESIQISTDTTNFFDSLTLTVVGPTFEDIAVIVRVVDSSGNEAFCFAEVSIRCGITDLCPFVDVEILSSDIACGFDTITVGATLDATELSGQWSTTGDGVFINDTLPITDYFPGPNDRNGDTIFIIYTQDSVLNCQPIDSAILILAPDTEAPNLVGCPGNPIEVENDAGWCGAIVNFPTITGIDNCDRSEDLIFEYSLNGGPYSTTNPSGSFFDVDTTGVEIRVRVMDLSGNLDSCSFLVLVRDKEAPQAVCQDAIFNLGLLCEGAMDAAFIDGGSTDNCEISSIQASRDGVTFTDSVEITQEDIAEPFINVTLLVTDEAGNTSICVASVEIEGANVNLDLCGADTTVSTEIGSCVGRVPDILPPFDSTNICGEIVNVRQVPAAGVLFGGQVGDSIVIQLISLSTGGIVDSCEVVAYLVDTEAPTWINCPRPAIVEKSMPNQCGAFVNFSLPTAIDNCEMDSIAQVDGTGLTSGDMFPVGKTTLEYIAYDASGNASEVCALDIFVNDGEAPIIECPEGDTLSTTAGLCGSIPGSISLSSPVSLRDNCPHLALVYEVTNELGEIVDCGVGDLTEAFLPKGNNTVTYRAQDQALLLITEVVQDLGAVEGGQQDFPSYLTSSSEDYIELTNFGPCALDLSCLTIEREGSDNSIFTLPRDIVLPVGAQLVLHFGAGTDDEANFYFNDSTATDIGSADPAGYTISVNGVVLDAVATNGYDLGEDFVGSVGNLNTVSGIQRFLECDHDNAQDWVASSGDNPASIGFLNTDLSVLPDNGDTCSLQAAQANVAECSFPVVVVDNELPSCDDSAMPLADVVFDNEPGICGAAHIWIHPCIADNCPMGTISVEYINDDPNAILPEGGEVTCGDTITEIFGCGETTVIYTLTDMSGNVSNCSFTVTVNDVEAPVVECPKDWTITLGEGECEVIKYFEVDEVSDNCEVDTLMIPVNGTPLPIGDTNIVITVVDKAGNSSTCSFNVLVEEFPNPTDQLGCNDQINISLGPDCIAEITPDMILEGGPYRCYDCYTVTVHPDADSDPIPNSPFVGTDEIGQNLVVMITDCETGNICWGNLLVENKILPEFLCPADTIVPCNALADPDFTGFPELLSCVPSVDVSYSDDYTDEGKCNLPRATVVRTWTITDASGLSVSCEQLITVDRINLANIEWPVNWDDISAPSFDCEDVANDASLVDPSNTGYPSIDGQPLELGVHPLCDITYFVEDEIFEACGGSYEIQRIWKISNLCEDPEPGVNPIVHIQRILVWDIDGPDVIAPGDVTLESGALDCGASWSVPVPVVGGDCSAYDYTVSTTGGVLVELGPDQYVLSDLPSGDSELTYVLEDECGNIVLHTITVTVEDVHPPIPVCDENTVVSVSSNGTARVFAETFDDGSFDNCADTVYFKVRSNPGPNRYEDYLDFDCGDVGREFTVTLRVFDVDPGEGRVSSSRMRAGGDLFGRYNDCDVTIVVQDQLPPFIACPSDLTLDCGDEIDMDALEDPRDETYGLALGFDNCSFTISVEVNMSEADCGEGSISRIFTVTDRQGLSRTCSQTITLINSDPLTESDIRWPSDRELSDACTEDIILDPSLTGEPVVNAVICSDVLINYDDEIFVDDADACVKIFRTWKVLDWCQYDEVTGAGIWTDLQIIKLSNNVAPVFGDLEPSLTACDSAAASCEGFIELTATATDDCSEEVDISYVIDAFDDGDIDVVATGSDASGVYPFGRHKIIWTAEDGCGNTTSFEQSFELLDCKKPSPKCFSGLVTVLMEGAGEVTIWASDFDAGSDDNCGDVIVSFSEDINDIFLTFTCNDLGTVSLPLWVTDESGNQDFCETFIFIQDNSGVCDSLSGSLGGVVYTPQALTLEGAEVELATDNGIIASMQTEEDGAYRFDNMPWNDDYTLTSFKNDDHRNGLSTFDIVKIQKHLLGLEPFDSPYKYIAADVNNNNSVSALDMVELRRLLLGDYDEFPENTSWRFPIEDQEFDDLTNPWPFDEIIEIDNFNQDEILDNNFIAVKVGDITGDAVTTGLMSSEDRTPSDYVDLVVEDEAVESGELVSLEIKAGEFKDVLGYQATLNWNSEELEWVGVNAAALDLTDANLGIHSVEQGRLGMSWNEGVGVTVNEGEVLFTIEFRVMDGVKARWSELLSLSDDIIRPEAYTESASDLSVRFAWNDDESEAVDFNWNLAQNSPNPFDEFTVIEFTLAETSDVTLHIHDAKGNTAMVKEGEYGAGKHQLSIKRSEIGAAGVWFYELRAEPKNGSDSYEATRKMIVLD